MSDSLYARPLAQAHSSWSLEIGRFRVAVSRTRDLSAPAARPRAQAFATGALAGVGGVALMVVGASAAPRPAETVRYMVSVPVPAAIRHVARPGIRAPASARRLPSKGAEPIGGGFDAADAPFVARAMATGAFQQWEDGDGRLRFLTAGPARFTGGRACRDLALLVRLADGGSHVRSAERCTTGPVTDDVSLDPAAATEPASEASGE